MYDEHIFFLISFTPIYYCFCFCMEMLLSCHLESAILLRLYTRNLLSYLSIYLYRCFSILKCTYTHRVPRTRYCLLVVLLFYCLCLRTRSSYIRSMYLASCRSDSTGILAINSSTLPISKQCVVPDTYIKI